MELLQTLQAHSYIQDKFYDKTVRARANSIKVISLCNPKWILCVHITLIS